MLRLIFFYLCFCIRESRCSLYLLATVAVVKQYHSKSSVMMKQQYAQHTTIFVLLKVLGWSGTKAVT